MYIHIYISVLVYRSIYVCLAYLVKGPARRERRVVARRAHGAHAVEPSEAQRCNGRLGATGQHHVAFAPLTKQKTEKMR